MFKRITLAFCLALPLATPAVHAQSSAQASGDLVGGSVEVGATLASAGLTVTAASVVAVAGTTAAIITADPDLADDTLELAGEIAAAPFTGNAPLEIDDAIIVPDAAPDVPYGGRQP